MEAGDTAPATAREAVLLAGLASPVAPVLPVSVTAPTELGVPLTVQVTLAPAGTASPADQAALAGLMRHAPWLTPPQPIGFSLVFKPQPRPHPRAFALAVCPSFHFCWNFSH